MVIRCLVAGPLELNAFRLPVEYHEQVIEAGGQQRGDRQLVERMLFLLALADYPPVFQPERPKIDHPGEWSAT